MDGKRLDLNLLVTLEALLVEQNVTRAAARLHLSQPAVSAQLARLRVLFDDPLLVPAQRGMTPTAKGLELLAPLRQSLDQVRTTVAEKANFDPARAELTLTIACTDYLQAVAVQPLCLALRQRAPGVRVAMCHLELQTLDAQMARGDVDLALMTPAAAPPSLRTRHLFDEDYVLIGRQGHPRLRKGLNAQAYAQLEHVVVSLRGGDFATPVDDALAALGLRRRVAVSAASFLLVPQLVAASDLVALVPRRLAAGSAQSLRTVAPPFAVPGFAVGMVWHERNHGHVGQRWLRETLHALCAEKTPRRPR
jgi:DNA-binding transcriptional LysR family regulator